MIIRCVRYGTIAIVDAGLLGSLLFGRELVSYVRSGAGRVQHSIKDSVPIEFELQRARDMVDQIIPELQANTHHALIARSSR